MQYITVQGTGQQGNTSEGALNIIDSRRAEA